MRSFAALATAAALALSLSLTPATAETYPRDVLVAAWTKIETIKAATPGITAEKMLASIKAELETSQVDLPATFVAADKNDAYGDVTVISFETYTKADGRRTVRANVISTRFGHAPITVFTEGK